MACHRDRLLSVSRGPVVMVRSPCVEREDSTASGATPRPHPSVELLMDSSAPRAELAGDKELVQPADLARRPPAAGRRADHCCSIRLSRMTTACYQPHRPGFLARGHRPRLAFSSLLRTRLDRPVLATGGFTRHRAGHGMAVAGADLPGWRTLFSVSSHPVTSRPGARSRAQPLALELA